MTIEYSMSAKWLELLREIAPSVNRVAVLRDPTQGSGTSEFAVIQAIAPSLRVEVSPINVRDGGEIERAIATFARSASGGLIVTTSGAASVHRALIIEVAARYRLPTVYYARDFVSGGGLISFGFDYIDQYQRAAGLRRPHPQRREAGRPACASADEVRNRDQPQDRQSARARRAADAARPRRRGDRMSAPGKAGAIQPVEVRPK